MVLASDLANAGSKYIGTPYSSMDCQAFVERCLKDCGLSINLSGSNAWYRKMTWRGSPEDCKRTFGAIPAGAFLFIVEEYSESTPEKYRKDGLKDATHIGIVTGKDPGAIHSSSTKKSVCESTFEGKTIPNGGWNMIGLWDQIFYSETVNKKLNEGDEHVTEANYATVCAGSGTSVKMRAQPSTGCATYWDIPIGSVVEVIDEDATWSRIRYGGRTGYMLSAFLAPSGEVPETKSQGQAAGLKEIYNLLAKAAGLAAALLEKAEEEDQDGVG